MTYLYIYNVTCDSGFAPCVQDGLLSLACCKGARYKKKTDSVIETGIRFWIGNKNYSDWEKDDVYIIGKYHGKLLYAARVTDVLCVKDYFTGIGKERYDGIYKYDENTNEFKDNGKIKVHCSRRDLKKDIGGKYVILSDDFTYLGKDAKNVECILNVKIPNNRETRFGAYDAEIIARECMKYKDEKIHKPNDYYKKCVV